MSRAPESQYSALMFTARRMLARYWPCTCLMSVRMSVRVCVLQKSDFCRTSVEADEEIHLGFGVGASLCYCVGYLQKITVIPSRTPSPKLRT